MDWETNIALPRASLTLQIYAKLKPRRRSSNAGRFFCRTHCRAYLVRAAENRGSDRCTRSQSALAKISDPVSPTLGEAEGTRIPTERVTLTFYGGDHCSATRTAGQVSARRSCHTSLVFERARRSEKMVQVLESVPTWMTAHCFCGCTIKLWDIK